MKHDEQNVTGRVYCLKVEYLRHIREIGSEILEEAVIPHCDKYELSFHPQDTDWLKGKDGKWPHTASEDLLKERERLYRALSVAVFGKERMFDYIEDYSPGGT